MTEKSRNSKWPFLHEAALTISAILDMDEVLQRLMHLAQRHFKPDAVSVALVEPDGSMVFRAASGKSSQKIVGMQMEPGSGIVGWVAERGEPLWVPDVHGDARFYAGADRQTGFTTTAILAIPVKLGDQVLAVLEMINPLPSTDLAEAEEVLTALASLAAPAIQNAQLFEQAQRAEARYQSLFAFNLDPIIILDGEGNFLELNQAAQRLLHASILQDEVACDLDRLKLSADQFEVFRAEADAGRVATWELEMKTLDGEQHRLEIYFSYLPYYGESGAYQWLAHDITDRVALEEMRQNLSSMIVHDLRLPLGSIINSMELVATAWQEQDGTIPVEQVLEIGLRSAHRMERLISNILDTSRLRTKERALSVSSIDVAALTEEMAEMIMPQARRRDQTVTYHVPDDLPPLQGDVDLLRRVLLNVLNNAVKYTPDGGNIRFSVEMDDDHFQFTVSDDGPGIPAEDQAHLFELFYRGKGQKVRGAGLGLAFCKLAVEAHGGRIWVESAVGEGSAFHLTIPHELPENAVYYEE